MTSQDPGQQGIEFTARDQRWIAHAIMWILFLGMGLCAWVEDRRTPGILFEVFLYFVATWVVPVLLFVLGAKLTFRLSLFIADGGMWLLRRPFRRPRRLAAVRAVTSVNNGTSRYFQGLTVDGQRVIFGRSLKTPSYEQLKEFLDSAGCLQSHLDLHPGVTEASGRSKNYRF
ncbi:MAG: hypothetical protein Q7Q71_06955 [Verrucomicrobiota bacterium JB023]|nr:hypothetical protein [Verrucomicrobiota bacterium JB023]